MNTIAPPPQILLIENDVVAADAIRKALATGDGGSFGLKWVRQLSKGLECLSNKGIAAILLGTSPAVTKALAPQQWCVATHPGGAALSNFGRFSTTWAPS